MAQLFPRWWVWLTYITPLYYTYNGLVASQVALFSSLSRAFVFLTPSAHPRTPDPCGNTLFGHWQKAACLSAVTFARMTVLALVQSRQTQVVTWLQIPACLPWFSDFRLDLSKRYWRSIPGRMTRMLSEVAVLSLRCCTGVCFLLGQDAPMQMA